MRREHAQLNRQVSVLRAASIRNRERAAQERARLASATAAVGSFDATTRAIAESVLRHKLLPRDPLARAYDEAAEIDALIGEEALPVREAAE